VFEQLAEVVLAVALPWHRLTTTPVVLAVVEADMLSHSFLLPHLLPQRQSLSVQAVLLVAEEPPHSEPKLQQMVVVLVGR
jgi:hypothetical protein